MDNCTDERHRFARVLSFSGFEVARIFPENIVVSEEQLISIVRDLFSAGAETTSNTIGFVIMYLAVRQDVQRKLHEEIKEVLGKETLPRIAHKNRYAYSLNSFRGVASHSKRVKCGGIFTRSDSENNNNNDITFYLPINSPDYTITQSSRLPYLNATIAEVARMSNVGPTSILHRAMANTTLLGYEIKKDYTLLANFISVHMDEKHWGDPREFRPERFINDEGEYVEDPWLMMFSLGRYKRESTSVCSIL